MRLSRSLVFVLAAASAWPLLAAPEFGFAPRRSLRLSEGAGTIPTYGVGPSLAVAGETVAVVFTARNVHDETEVRLLLSDDAGDSWGSREVVAFAAGYNGDGAAVAIGQAASWLHVVWGSDAPGPIWYARRRLGAAPTWSSPVDVSGGVAADGWARALAVDAAGGVHVVFATERGAFYSASPDGGATFPTTGLRLADEPVSEPAVAVGAQGDVFAAWQSGEAVRFSRLSAGSREPAAPRRVNERREAARPAIAASAGTVCVAWGGRRTAVACSDDGGSTWSEDEVSPIGAQESPGLAFGPDGVLNLVWKGSPDSGPAVYFSRRAAGSWSQPAIVEALRNESPNLAVDAAGRAFVVFSGGAAADAVYFSRERVAGR